MPPKEKKGKKAGGKDYQERGKGDQKSALNAKKNIQDKKADKKRADKSVNDGVKFLKKAEGQGGHKKKIVLEQAKVSLQIHRKSSEILRKQSLPLIHHILILYQRYALSKLSFLWKAMQMLCIT